MATTTPKKSMADRLYPNGGKTTMQRKNIHKADALTKAASVKPKPKKVPTPPMR